MTVPQNKQGIVSVCYVNMLMLHRFLLAAAPAPYAVGGGARADAQGAGDQIDEDICEGTEFRRVASL